MSVNLGLKTPIYTQLSSNAFLLVFFLTYKRVELGQLYIFPSNFTPKSSL